MPSQTQEFLERLRNRVKLPADGPRAQGRLARQRERAFDFALKNPNTSPEDLRAKLKELQEHPDDMRRERRRHLHARWGATALDPRAKPELEQHARRMARIRRMQFVAATERTAEKRAELLERLSRLRDLERGRHERALQAIAAGKSPDTAAPLLPSLKKPLLPMPSARAFGVAPKAAPSGSAKGGDQ
jgi:hypothetical protein